MRFKIFDIFVHIHHPLTIKFMPSYENREIFYFLRNLSMQHVNPLPPDFRFVASRSIDTVKLMSLLHSCGFHLSKISLQYALDLCIPDGIHVIEYLPSGCYAASMMSRHLSLPNFPSAGNIGWLSTAPKFRGQGLGYSVAVAATNHLLSRGYTNIWVSTHLHRKGAVKIFKALDFEQFPSDETYNDNML